MRAVFPTVPRRDEFWQPGSSSRPPLQQQREYHRKLKETLRAPDQWIALAPKSHSPFFLPLLSPDNNSERIKFSSLAKQRNYHVDDEVSEPPVALARKWVGPDLERGARGDSKLEPSRFCHHVGRFARARNQDETKLLLRYCFLFRA